MRGGAPGFHQVLAWCRRPAALTVIGVFALAGVGSRIVAGYYAPADFAQEVVAAQRFDATGTLYSKTVDADMRAWLAADPPPHQNWLPMAARERFAALRQNLPELYGAQAHPPLLLLAVWPLVHLLGGYNAYLVVTAATLAAAIVAVTLMLWWAAPRSVTKWWLLAALLALGWQPTLTSIRNGQVGVVIAALGIAGWFALRKRHDLTGGLIIGVAGALKLYPVLLAGLLLRRPRALAGFIGVALLAFAVVAVAAGLSEVQSYREAASLVVDRFGLAPNNASLWARLAQFGMPVQLAQIAGIGGTLVALTLLVAPVADRTPLWASDVEDFRTGALICLTLLLSPITWDHYFFLLILPVWLTFRGSLVVESRTALVCCLVGTLAVSLSDLPFWRLRDFAHAPIVQAVISPTFALLACWASCLWWSHFGQPLIRSAPVPSPRQA